MIVRDENIGGAFVRRTFTMVGGPVPVGKQLSRAEVLAIPSLNRQALIDGGKLDIYPPAAGAHERHVVSAGFGKFHVYEGRRVNTDPLSKEQAEALAAEGGALPGEIALAQEPSTN